MKNGLVFADKELVKRAALAAGLNLAFDSVGGLWYTWVETEDGQSVWNPLEDDGDALRLANKLFLEVRHVHGKAHAGMMDGFWCSEPWFPSGDQDEATRRAIVRAAAAMADRAA